MISVVIPTRGTGDFSKLFNLLKSLTLQTLQPEEILIVIDFDVPRQPLLESLSKLAKTDRDIAQMNVALINQDGYRVSAARNYGIAHANGDYVLLCDDDVVLHEENCIEQLYGRYHMHTFAHDDDRQEHTKEDIIIYPTITFHDTQIIQTQGFISYNWLLCWPVPKKDIERKSKIRKWLPVSWFQTKPSHGDVQLIGSICIFSSKDTLARYPYDDRFTFIYEDLERSYRAYVGGVSIYVPEAITVQHRENEKDMLARSYIDTPEHVYLKTRHRIWFALKHARGWQLLLFYLVGFWVSNAWTLLYIYLYGKIKNKLRKSWRKGIVDGLSYDPPSLV